MENNKLQNRHEMFRVMAGRLTWTIEYNGPECSGIRQYLPANVTYDIGEEGIYYIFVGQMGAFLSKTDPSKPMDGTGEFSLS